VSHAARRRDLGLVRGEVDDQARGGPQCRDVKGDDFRCFGKALFDSARAAWTYLTTREPELEMVGEYHSETEWVFKVRLRAPI
jgi:hypothetical protein